MTSTELDETQNSTHWIYLASLRSRESTTYPRFGNWKGGTLPPPFTKYNMTASHEEELLPPYKTHLPEVGIRGGPLSPSCTCSTNPNLTWQSQLLQENRSQTWLCAPRGHLIICGHPKGRLQGPIYVSPL